MKKAVILLADGFEEIEALSVVDILRRAEIICDMCSLEGQIVTGSHDIKVKPDIAFKDADFEVYDALILPGGMRGSIRLRDDESVIELVSRFNKQGKVIGAICAAPIVLQKAGVIEGRKATSHPSVQEQLNICAYGEEITLEDGNIITSRGAGTAIYFAFHILKKLGLGEKADELKKSMMLSFVEEKIKG